MCLKPLSLEDLSRLPPNQKSKHLQNKLENIQKELLRETEQRYRTITQTTIFNILQSV